MLKNKKNKIRNLFMYNAAGTLNKAKKTNDAYLLLLLLCKDLEDTFPSSISLNNSTIHLEDQLKALGIHIDNDPLKLDQLYAYVVNNWDSLKGRTHTYRLLADMVDLSLWKDENIDQEKLKAAIYLAENW